MIINDTHSLVFVHIPKCAGTTVRNTIHAYDQTNGRYTSRFADHERLGRIDYAHIPLFILRGHFPDEYRKVLDYNSYAIVRDPYSRFASSFSQYLRRTGAGQIVNQKHADIKKKIDTVINILEQHLQPQAYLPYQYIHFQRQVDFVYDQSVKKVKNIYDISDILTILSDIHSQLGIRFDQPQLGRLPKANEALVYRNMLVGKFMEFALPAVNQLKKSKFKRFFKGTSVRNVFYVPRNDKLKSVFESQHVRDFVSAYYAADIDLYRENCRTSSTLTSS